MLTFQICFKTDFIEFFIEFPPELSIAAAGREANGSVYSDSFQRMSCSYKTTLPEELNVYLTSTCCCILPVLFSERESFHGRKAGGADVQ
jgi:hypothetical protein